jgi:GntR family transcriptional regulator of arabinose operon
LSGSKSGLPKHSQLKEYLLQRIRNGEWPVGRQIATENALAAEFKFSRHTVRQALRDLEQEGWISRQKGRGTFVSDHINNRSHTVAVIIKSITNHIFPDIVSEMENTLYEANFDMRLFLTHNNPQQESKYLQRAINSGVSGIIIEPARNTAPCTNLEYYHEMERRGIPYLLIHSVWPELDPAYVLLDDCRGGYLATQYLLQLGHRRIASIFNTDLRQALDRQSGYKQALSEYGIQPDPRLIGDYQYRTQYASFPFQFTCELLKREDPPTAIFCYNDLDAIRVLEGVRQSGIKVPDDLSVIGYNDSILTTVTEVKLTSVKHPRREMGFEATRLMIDMIEHRIEKPRTIFQPELIIRSSCRMI